MQHLPKLLIAGEMFCPDSAMHRTCLATLNTKWLRGARKPTTYCLQEVSLLKVRSLPDKILLPNLRTLNLQNPLDNFQWDPRLSTVCELGVFNTTMYTLVHILGQFGKQLTKLNLYITDTVPMSQIFDLCPKLQYLCYIEAPNVSVSMTCGIEPDALRQLTVLDLSSMEFDDDFVADPEVLLLLLQAPELRRIKVSWFATEQREVDQIVHRLQHREILQKLECAMMEPLHKYRRFHPLFSVEERQINLLLSEMALNCPNLIGVFDLTVDNSIDDWDGDI